MQIVLGLVGWDQGLWNIEGTLFWMCCTALRCTAHAIGDDDNVEKSEGQPIAITGVADQYKLAMWYVKIGIVK